MVVFLWLRVIEDKWCGVSNVLWLLEVRGWIESDGGEGEGMEGIRVTYTPLPCLPEIHAR